MSHHDTTDMTHHKTRQQSTTGHCSTQCQEKMQQSSTVIFAKHHQQLAVAVHDNTEHGGIAAPINILLLCTNRDSKALAACTCIPMPMAGIVSVLRAA